jgi:hypothetical protein
MSYQLCKGYLSSRIGHIRDVIGAIIQSDEVTQRRKVNVA